jgi:RNA polymerase sigma-70 factor (ECF subfamily)
MVKQHSSEETRPSLIKEVSRGNQDSWGEFVSLYEPLLLGYVLGQGLGKHDAGDVVQDVFIKLFRTLPNFKLDHQRGRFRTWLWQVTSTTIVDWARKRKRQAKTEEGLRTQLKSGGQTSREPDPEFDRAFKLRVMSVVFQKVRANSQPKTWACFEKHVLEGRPSAEVGAELGLNANSVNVNASRVLARVREMCAYYKEEELANE